MKASILTLVLVTLMAFFVVRESAARNVVGVWKVNWEKTEPTIRAVPETFTNRIQTVEDFKKLVAKGAKGLVLDIQPSNTAVMHHPSGSSLKLTWSEDTKYDIWVEQRFFMTAGIGHGFTVSGANTAKLNFQIEWNENVATRVPLIMERQQTDSANSK
ncbi:MAG: hypothetical protein J0L73_09975 [Verrucomicrobia bacterium]|nr:hypothetical protein [Verrucomicrobiota bacterium]